MESSPWAGMGGAPSGPPEWPDPGGYWNQLSRVVQAVAIMREEFGLMRSETTDGKKGNK